MDTYRIARARYPRGSWAAVATFRFDTGGGTYTSLIFDGELDGQQRDARSRDAADVNHERLHGWVERPDVDPFTAKNYTDEFPAAVEKRRGWLRRLFRRRNEHVR